MLRWLDNERQYLKNQLQYEMTCKVDLLEAVRASEEKVEEIQKSRKLETEALCQQMQKDRTVSEKMESEMNGRNQELKIEVDSTSEQIVELKNACTKLRDELRMEQAMSEQMQGTNERLAEELKAS